MEPGGHGDGRTFRAQKAQKMHTTVNVRDVVSMGSVGYQEPMDFSNLLKETYWKTQIETLKLTVGNHG